MSSVSEKESDKPLITIGVPTYNRPAQLAVVLRQLCAQTYDNIEIIVSDNGSSGHQTSDIVAAAMKDDERIRYIHQDPPLTAARNFEYLLRQARGCYFMWAADDDSRSPELVATLFHALCANPGAVLSYCEPVLTQRGVRLGGLTSSVASLSPDPIVRARAVLLNQNMNSEIYGLFRTDALTDFDFSPYYGSDHGILLHLALKGAIVQGATGLFEVAMGGVGATAEGVIRAFGLKPTFLNRHFGLLNQTMGLYWTACKAVPLPLYQRLRLVLILVKRLFLNRGELLLGFKSLLKNKLRPVRLILDNHFSVRARREAADYRRVAKAMRANMVLADNEEKKSTRILLVTLEGMNHFVIVIFSVLTWGLRAYGYETHAVSLRVERRNNRLLRLFRIPITFLEDCCNSQVEKDEAAAIQSQLSALENLSAVLAFTYEGMPLGKFAVSTWCRTTTSGDIDLTCVDVREAVGRIAAYTFLNYARAKKLFLDLQIKKIFCTELNTDSYGGFYLAARHLDLDIVRFASSNRDNAYFLQHMGREFNSWHHSALAPATWKRLREEPFRGEEELKDFFAKRYGGAWMVFSRNYYGTSAASSEEARASLGIGPTDPFVIVFSHILYDTLYFYGEDLFDSYVQWLIQTLKAAIANPRVTWGIKLHPSNVWRGAVKKQGKFEEERLLDRYVDNLPPHVKLIQPDTKISPLSWMQSADFGITVRGTAGLEMATMGKTVITAGRGRYDRAGFTTDPDTAQQYLDLLARIPDLPRMNEDQVALARRYMHAVFVRKAFQVTSVDTELATGKKKLVHYNDLLLLPSTGIRGKWPTEWPDVRALAEWLSDRTQLDYLHQQVESDGRVAVQE